MKINMEKIFIDSMRIMHVELYNRVLFIWMNILISFFHFVLVNYTIEYLYDDFADGLFLFCTRH